jgi:hypothetical protein
MSVVSACRGASLGALLVFLLPAAARAAPPAPAAATAAATVEGPEPIPPPAADAPLIDVAGVAAELQEQKKDIAEQKKALEEAQETIAGLEKKVDAATAASDENDWTSRFKLYGFTDVGLNRIWINEKSYLANNLNAANATSFVIGNLNVYFDAQPVKSWRSLVEIRFTNAPHGEIATYGGLAGKFKRTTTEQLDPHAGSVGGAMWGGYTVIERAHVDWTELQYLKVRAGNFFTPFGIWNVDHGSPTLISVQLPGVIQLRQMPLRQTGVQIYGSAFKGDWELGYAATISNGRQELSNFAFDDNRGFGGRLFANNEKGEATVKLGASFYTGRVRDQQIDVTGPPIAFESKSTFDAREIVGGVDASVDVGRTRIRSEVTMSSVAYEPGKHEPAQALSVTPQYRPDSIETTGYLLLAHTLPFAPIELYGMADVLHGPLISIGDTLIAPSLGVNLRFTKATMLKTQVSETFFLDLRGRGTEHKSAMNNFTSVVTRLVLVF